VLNTKQSLKKTQYWVKFTDLANNFSIYIIVMETESKHWNYIIPRLLLFSLWAGWSEDLIPVGARFSVPGHTYSGTHPTFCKMRTGSFYGVKRQRRSVDHPPYIHDPKFIFEILNLWYLDISFVCIEKLNSSYMRVWVGLTFVCQYIPLYERDMFVKSFVTWSFFEGEVTSLQFKYSV
jgi:hypothetical protein